MTARTPDALASALPPAISYEVATNVYWDRRVVAQVQAERLAEAGYVLIHTAPDEATVERLARVFLSWDTPFDWDSWPEIHLNLYRQRAHEALRALADTSAQARRTADDATGGGEA